MTRRIGSRYTVTRVIGRGTCGTVWAGRGPDGAVAIKLLHDDLTADQTLIARFVQERTVLTSLRHPRIVGVRDLVVDGNDLALVMDLISGSDLRERLERRGPLAPAEAVSVCRDIADALAAAHARGVVHRDVKPENVLLDESGVARLTDFGIARLVDGPRRTRATRIVGTPDYLAPEVIEGCPPTPAVDVYALATVLFELLTGWSPFGGGHPGAVLRRHVTEPAPRVPGMPKGPADLLERCLAKSPAVRLSAAEFSAQLAACLPALAGLPPLRIASPRGDRPFTDPDVMTHAGAVPLVAAAADALGDDARVTHVNLIRAIREPLGPDRPVAEPEPLDLGPAEPAEPLPSAAPPGPDGPGEAALPGQRPGVRRLLAFFGIGSALVGALGYTLSQDGGAGPAGSDAAQRGATQTATGAAAAVNGSLEAIPVSGEFGFATLAALPAPAAHAVGAVQLAYAGSTLYAASTGSDGLLRIAAVPGGSSGGASGSPAGIWSVVPGLSSSVQPALVGRHDGTLELYATSPGGLVARNVLTPGVGWEGWSSLGTEHVAGPPAAAAYAADTVVIASSTDQTLLEAVLNADGGSAGWQRLPQAGPILPQLALTSHGTALAAYVVRASDGATLRVSNDGGGWQAAWPTGAAGQPATAYAADGRPDLFVLSASAGVQVFQPSGRDLHGTMTWLPAGVPAAGPPGVAEIPGGGVVLAVAAADGSVGVYRTAR
ncbi:serine/threonine protein kinase [Actinospica durhamensis]|uniref:non-specific serine/threonine protein kinase n=1 Tax=Actinospica durhamensis TaxID=1508375 RepID=A0A941IVC8_9ACTN|nr:protein kinase [Actinospica durhamensis]MBR7839083.1 serine/threonine protein kinase [Actinospica durhamensis]